MGSHRVEALHLSLQVLSHCKSTAASGASSVGETISFILKANSGLGLKCGGFVWFFLKKYTYLYISKQNLDLSVVGINHWKACQFLNSKAAKLKLVKIFLKECTKAYTLKISSFSCSYASCHSAVANLCRCPTVTTAKARKWVLFVFILLFQ